jgi:hypothetical protein
VSEQSALGTAELFWLPGVSPSAPNERVHSAYRLLYLMSNKIAMDQGVHHTPRPTDHPPHAAPHGAALFGSFVIHPDPNAYVTPDGAWQRTRGVVYAGISLLSLTPRPLFGACFALSVSSASLPLWGPVRDALEGKGSQRRPQKLLDRRLGAVTVGYKCH